MSEQIKIFNTQIESLAAEPDELSDDMFASEMPIQHTLEFLSDEDKGIYIGLWDTTSMQEVAGAYPMEEFMVVLEGKADIALQSGSNAGKVRQVHTDEGFVIPHGTDCQWQQQGYLKKLFVIVENSELCPVNSDVEDIRIFGPEHSYEPYLNQAKSFVVYPWSVFTQDKDKLPEASLAVVYCQHGRGQYQTDTCEEKQVMLIENFEPAKFASTPQSSGFVVLIIE